MADSGGKIIVYSAIGFFVGLSFIYYGLKRYLLVQKIKNTPSSKVEAAPVGLVEICGKAECHDPTKSPISSVDCAYWRLEAQYYQSGKNGGWRQIYHSDSTKQFYVQDETGKMLVDPKGADIDIPIDNTFSGYISGHGIFGASHSAMDQRVLRFIDSLDGYSKSAFMMHQNEEVRLLEYFIADDDTLFVLGSAEPIEGASSAVNYENLLIRKGDVDKTMYISDTGERKVIDKLSGWMYWHIFGGLAISAVCLFIFLAMLGV